MGMDYGGVNGSDFHLTIHEHQMVYGLLRQAGADLAEWSWTNEGNFISEKACRNWAKLLRSNVNKLIVPEDFERPRPNPLPGTPWQIASPEDYKRIVLEFADFLSSCGGCRQS